jgi:hypothetical protein
MREPYSVVNRDVSAVLHMRRMDQLFFPTFQRFNRWSLAGHSECIRSLLDNTPIGQLVLYTPVSQETRQARYGIVDGGHRIRTIVQYAENAFALEVKNPVTGMMESVFYDALPDNLRHPQPRARILPEEKLALVEADHHCAQCRVCLQGKSSEVDHIVPLSEGGPHAPINTQLLCIPCHKKKTAEENRLRSERFSTYSNCRVMTAREQQEFHTRELQFCQYRTMSDSEALDLFSRLQYSAVLNKNDELAAAIDSLLIRHVTADENGLYGRFAGHIERCQPRNVELTYWSTDRDTCNVYEFVVATFRSYTERSEQPYCPGDGTRKVSNVVYARGPAVTMTAIENFDRALTSALDLLEAAGVLGARRKLSFSYVLTYLHCILRWGNPFAAAVGSMARSDKQLPWEDRWGGSSQPCAAGAIAKRMGQFDGKTWRPGTTLKRGSDER